MSTEKNEEICRRCDAPKSYCDCPDQVLLPSNDRQRIELAIELIENVPGKSVRGARSLLKSALRKL